MEHFDTVFPLQARSLILSLLQCFELHLGIAFLLLRPSAHHDLELGLVEGHQAEVEAWEEATEAEEYTEKENGGPDW